MYSDSPRAKRVEFRCPDPTANPYLAFSALLMAALDGIDNKIHPGEPMDKNLYDLAPEEAANLQHVPDSLRGSLDALSANHSFLTRGGVFSEDFIHNFIELKSQEYDAVRLRPHPHEFHLYYDV